MLVCPEVCSHEIMGLSPAVKDGIQNWGIYIPSRWRHNRLWNLIQLSADSVLTGRSEKHITVAAARLYGKVGKVKCGTIGYENVRSFQRPISKMAYTVDERVFIVETFYQASSFAVQRQFRRKFNKWQTPIATSHLI